MRIIKFLLFFLFFCSLLTASEVVLLQSTDIHGHLSGEGYQPGIERIGAKIQELRKNNPKNLILFDCGDLIQGTFSAWRDRGASMIKALNYLKYDFWVPGNHDFDYGVANLRQRISEFNGIVLAANINFSDQPANVKRWMMFHREGKKIAVIGFVPPFLPHWIAPAQLLGIRQIPIEKVLPDIMKEVRRHRPDLIFVAIHIGEFIPGRLVGKDKRQMLYRTFEKYPDIRLLFGGHSHMTVPLKNAGYFAKYTQAPALSGGVSCVKVTFPKNKFGEMTFSGEIIPVENMDPDPGLYSLLDEHRKNSIAEHKKIIAHVPFSLGGTKQFGEMLGKSLLDFTKAEAALCSAPSNYRSRPGKIRNSHLFFLIPYENYISVLTVGPSELKSILREQYSLKQKNMFMPLTSRRVKYKIKENKLYLDNREWTDESQKIRVALTSYAASGAGGRYVVLRKITNQVKREEKNATLRDVFRVWLNKNYNRKRR